MRRIQVSIPLSLPAGPESAAQVSARLAAFATTYAQDRMIALLDVDGAGTNP